MKKHRWQLVIGAGLLVLGAFIALYLSKGTLPAFFPSNIPNSLLNSVEACHVDGRVYTIKDAGNNLLSKMSRVVSVGDELITAGGKLYSIDRVKGRNAIANFKGVDKDFIAWQNYFSNQAVPVANQQGYKSNKVAIYHTHSAESYVPTDGTESKPGNGGIFQVGNAFAEQLKKEGVEVIHDTSSHEPRDKNSYYRSRRTAVQLLKQNPVTLIDIHRDGIPDPNYYSKQVNGQNVTQMRLVVGRQNPKMESNKEFAKRVMAAVNKQYPGLIKEIFIANGNYNQDLTPTAMLVEVGTHTNSREAAEKGIALFADSLPDVLGIGKAATKGTYRDPNASTPGGLSTIGITIAVLVLGGAAFLLVSSGSWENARDRLNSYISKEFVNLLVPGRRKRKNKDHEGIYDPDANEAARSRREDIRND